MKANSASRFLDRLKKVGKEVRNFHRVSMGIANVLDDFLTQKFDGKQKDFAAFLGKKDSEISKWLSGNHNFTLKSIAFLEAKLDTKILFTKYDRQFSHYENKRAVVFQILSDTPAEFQSLKSQQVSATNITEKDLNNIPTVHISQTPETFNNLSAKLPERSACA